MTRRSYTDLQRRPDAFDGDGEATDAHLGTSHGGLRPGHVVPGRSEGQADLRAVAHGGVEPRRRAAAGAEDEDVDLPDPVRAEGLEHVTLVRRAAHRQHHRPVCAPEVGAAGDRLSPGW
jgi:hypothetical protein